MNYAVSTLYYRVLQISRSPGWSGGGGKRAEVINSDECCIIEELRGRAFNGKGGGGGGTSCVERAQREKRGKGGEMFENREITRPLYATLSLFRVFHQIIHRNS